MNRVHKSKVKPSGFPTRYIHAYIPPAATSDPNHHPFNVFTSSRLRRAPGGDKLDDAIDKMEAVARIATGVALEIGLINGSIPVEDAISELLRIGDLTVADLESMKLTDLKTALTQMTNLSGSLGQFTPEDTEFEKRFLALDGAREKFDALGSIGSLSGKQEFVDKLTKVATDQLKADNTKQLLSTTVHFSLSGLPPINDMRSDTDDTVHSSEFIMLGRISVDDVVDNLKNLLSTFEKVNNIATLKEGHDFMNPLNDEKNLHSEVDGTNSLFLGNTKMATYLTSLKDIASACTSSAPVIQTLQKLVDSRTDWKQWKFAHSSGFSEGAKDLVKLHDDTENSWMKKVMKKEENSANLKKAFLSMEGFKRNLNDVETAWKQKITGATGGSVDSVAVTQTALSDSSYGSDTHKKVLDDYEQCDATFRTAAAPFDTTPLTSAQTSLGKLATRLKDVSKLNYQDGLTELESLKTKLASVTDASGMKQFVTDWKANKSGDKAIEFLEQLEKNLQFVQSLNDAFFTEVTNTKSNVNALDTYVTSLNTSKYVALYTCIKNVVNRDIGRKKMDVLKSFRSATNDQSIVEVTGIVQAVEDSLATLNKTKTAGENMKNVKDAETEAMKKSSPKSKEISSKLGLAVRGLQMIREVDKKKSELNALTGDVSSIITSANANQNNMDPATFASLQKFTALQTDLNTMLQGISTFRGAIQEMKESSLAENHDVFTAAAVVPSVTVDANELRSALENLATIDASFASSKQPFLDSLDTLDKLNVDFASYKFTEAKQSLTDLDTFFASFYTATQSARATLPPSSRRSANVTGNLGQASKAASSDPFPNYYWGIIGGGILLLAVAVGAGYFIKQKYFQSGNDLLSPSSRTRCLLRKDPKKKDKVPLMVKTLVFVRNARGEPVNESLTPKGWASRLKTTYDAQSQLEVVEVPNMSFIIRQPVPCKTNALVSVSDLPEGRKYYHGSKLGVDDEHHWIMAHSPVQNGEMINGGNLTDSRYKLYGVIRDYKVGVVIQLCDFFENGARACAPFHSDKVNGVETYADITGAKAVCTTVELVNVSVYFPNDKNVSCFKVNYETTRGEGEELILHQGSIIVLRYLGWAPKTCPTSTVVATQMIKFADSHNANVMVISATGLGRAATLTTIKKGIEMCLMGDADSFQSILSQVRNARLFALETPGQYIYSFVAIMKGVCELCGIKNFPEGFPFEFYNEQVNSGKLDAVTNAEGNFPDNLTRDAFARETTAYVHRRRDEWDEREKERKEKNGEAAKERAEQERKDAEWLRRRDDDIFKGITDTEVPEQCV